MNSKGVVNPPAKFMLGFFLLGLIGAGIILVATSRYGSGLSADSVGYIATGRHISDGTGFITYNGSPLVGQPPLYPAILASVDFLFGIDPLFSARIIGAILFGLMVFLSGLLFFRHMGGSPAIPFVATLFVLFASPLVQVSIMAWSESLFICFVLLFLIFSEVYLSERGTGTLLLLSIVTALACLTRYIGLILIPVGVINLILFRRDSWKTTIRNILLFLVVALLPIGLWALRNYSISGTFFGPRATSSYPLLHNLSYTFDTVLFWYLPMKVVETPPFLMLLCLTIGFAAGASIKAIWPNARIILKKIFPALLLIIAYTGFLIISSTITAFDQIGDRLLSPIFVPTTLLLTYFAYEIIKSLARRLPEWLANTAVISVFLLAVLYPVITTVLLVSNYIDIGGGGLNNKIWRESATLQYLLQHPSLQADCPIYSNGPDAIYILANIVAKPSPAKSKYNSSEAATDISSLNGRWPQEKKVCLVWFDTMSRKYLFKADELQTIAKVDKIASLEDGSIYVITPK